MKDNYLLLVSDTYAFAILRPLQAAIRARGGQAAWFLDNPACRKHLAEDETELRTVREVIDFNPKAVFAPGNHAYHFFPGIKVQVFHGYAMNKRADAIDDHFTIRGWFDMYCTQGPSSTGYFEELAEKYGFFKVYETGWSKVDPFFSSGPEEPRDKPTILYAPTFTRSITSAYDIYDTLDEIAGRRDWRWIITFHPKLVDPELIEKYEELDRRHENVTFQRYNDGLNTFRRVDMMLCDSSSIIVEVEMLGKPVVTFRNTMPGPHLIDVQELSEVEGALERALSHPPELMAEMLKYTAHHEAHREGRNSENILDAVDDFAANWQGRLRPKKISLVRRLKARKKLGYWGGLNKL